MCDRCHHAFRSKRIAECKANEKSIKRARASESDSMKSVRQAKDKLHKASKRVSETREQTRQRQQQDRLHKASMKAIETPEQTRQRQQQDQWRKASMRAIETHEQTRQRQQQDQVLKGSMRAIETTEQTRQRQQKDQFHKASMRAIEMPEQTLLRQKNMYQDPASNNSFIHMLLNVTMPYCTHTRHSAEGLHFSAYIGMNVCGSAYENGCMVDGTCAMAAD